MSDIYFGIFHRPSFVFASLRDNLPSARSFFLKYGMPVIIVGAFGRAYSASFVLSDSPGLLLTLLVIHLVSFSFSFVLGSWLISRLANYFKFTASAGKILVLVITAYIPFLVALAIASVFPDSALIRFIGLAYTILVFGKGTGVLLGAPPARKAGFTILAFFLLFGGNYLINLLLELLFLPHPTI